MRRDETSSAQTILRYVWNDRGYGACCDNGQKSGTVCTSLKVCSMVLKSNCLAIKDRRSVIKTKTWGSANSRQGSGTKASKALGRVDKRGNGGLHFSRN